MEQQVPISLANVCEGGLEEQFQRMYPALIASIKPGKSASISFNITFKRLEDTATMVNTSFSVTPKFPAIKKASICQITGENKLKTDAPVEKVIPLNLISGGYSNE
jgi:hypothetical protein